MSDPFALGGFSRDDLPAVAPEPRAYTIINDMPPGHTVVYIDDARHWPHLKRGESVLVDTTDRDIIFGEVYLVRQSRGPILWQICKNHRPDWTPGVVCAWLRPLNNPPPRKLANGTWDLAGCHFSDGPIRLDALAEQIIGRVVGLFVQRPYDPAVGFGRTAA